ncbi:TMEM175 family protein [Microbacterium sp. 179-I 3D3 NHS]|uniref:TMEM175 family protein n=1 Tax=unclassified Microbacterium TaxID=2609290 RepID=UPI00399F8447
MIRRRHHPDGTQNTRRLEAFTDGVFAIAATLLVLDLTSHSLGTVTTDAEMWAALGGMWDLLVNFVLSFVLLGLLWLTHVQQFEFIARIDGTMAWLNCGRLLFIVLVPFATNLTTEHSEFLASRLAMPVTFFMAILFGTLQWMWALRHAPVMLPDLAPEDARSLGRGSLSALIISAAVVAASPWIGSIAFVLFLADAPLTRFLRSRGASAASPAASGE